VRGFPLKTSFSAGACIFAATGKKKFYSVNSEQTDFHKSLLQLIIGNFQTLTIAVIGCYSLKITTDINSKFHTMYKGDGSAQYAATVSACLT
jgi:hypothetical protein